MKYQIPSLLTCLAIVFFFLTGCQKGSGVVIKTKTDLVSQSSWKFEKGTASGTDITTSVPACIKDNVYLFVSNGTGSVDEALTICSPSNAGPFTWNFQTNETILHISAALFPGGSNDFTLVSLTETNLIVSQVMTIPPNPPTTVEVTFKH